MVTTENFVEEKSELDAVLASGILDRSQNLAQLLNYVCQKYFEGNADQVKEYNIAVDALGRTVDFDQKKDSIVRVQFHRLRERLAAFYASDGASHALRIVIPQGQYVPRFVATGRIQEPTEPSVIALPENAVTAKLSPLIPKAVHKFFGRKWIVVVVVAMLLSCAGVLVVERLSLAKSPASRPPQTEILSAAAGAGATSIRILCGLDKGTYTDGFGRVWQHDEYSSGGSTIDLPKQPIFRTREPRLFQSRRQGQFRYDIPVGAGNYEVRLYFAETVFGEMNTAGYGGEASRAFSIEINGKTVKERLDVVGEVGASTADIKVYRDISPASDGLIHISFGLRVGIPFLNAIEITPGTPGGFKPIRMVMQPRGYTDTQGRYWEPDRFAAGGVMVTRTMEPVGTTDAGLWTGERFGNLTYTIPVPTGTYEAHLYMAERWLGPGMPSGGGGAGSRLFDILCNGVALERDFDLFQRAGGANHAFIYKMRGLRPNHQDQLVISLVPSKNFPLLNALEIVDQTAARYNGAF